MGDRTGSAPGAPGIRVPPRWVFRKEDARATEPDATQRVGFFRDVLGPVARGIPFGVWFIRTVDGVDLDRPSEAAQGRRVFELQPLP